MYKNVGRIRIENFSYPEQNSSNVRVGDLQHCIKEFIPFTVLLPFCKIASVIFLFVIYTVE